MTKLILFCISVFIPFTSFAQQQFNFQPPPPSPIPQGSTIKPISPNDIIDKTKQITTQNQNKTESEILAKSPPLPPLTPLPAPTAGGSAPVLTTPPIETLPTPPAELSNPDSIPTPPTTPPPQAAEMPKVPQLPSAPPPTNTQKDVYTGFQAPQSTGGSGSTSQPKSSGWDIKY